MESLLSKPLITSNTLAIVLTCDDMIPIVSIELANGISPYLETRPYVGFNPMTPQNEAGNRTDPPVSDPKALYNHNYNIKVEIFKKDIFAIWRRLYKIEILPFCQMYNYGAQNKNNMDHRQWSNHCMNTVINQDYT